MHSLSFDRFRGRWLGWACLLGIALGACSEASPGVGEQSNSSESDDEDEQNDEGDDSSSPAKPDARASAPQTPKDAGRADAGSKPSTGKDAGTPTAGGGGAGIPCDVSTILDKSCGTCHGEELAAGAPMKLTAQADFMAMSSGDKVIKDLVKQRINASSKPMPPPPGKLSADELATLNAWLDDGAPASDEKCAATQVPSDSGDIDKTGLDCYKLTAHASGSKTEKYTADTGETYINFGFKAPWSGAAYMVLSNPVIDNKAVVHHWLLYKENVQDGSVTPTIGQHSGGELLTGWAPGGKPIDLRIHGSVGVEMAPDSYSIEIHYNNNTGGPAQDASGVEICVAKQVENVASLSWLGYDQGGTISYASGICLDPASTWESTCAPVNHTEPIHIVNIVPHMHQSGTHMKAVINSPNGQTRILHDEDFAFDYQIAYDVDEVLMPGETITTTCTFSAPNCAGQSTSQEMCYLYTLHYPAKSLIDLGPEGTFMHGEGVCLGQ